MILAMPGFTGDGLGYGRLDGDGQDAQAWTFITRFGDGEHGDGQGNNRCDPLMLLGNGYGSSDHEGFSARPYLSNGEDTPVRIEYHVDLQTSVMLLALLPLIR